MALFSSKKIVERFDSSLRPVLLNLDSMKVTNTSIISKDVKNLSDEQVNRIVAFRNYEYFLFICAQLSRLIYSDTGIIWSAINSGSLGISNDIVNKVISAYDAKYAKEKKIPLSPSENARDSRPMQSYLLQKASPTDQLKYGTYISSADDMTCMILDSSKITRNRHSKLLPTDVFIIFKGTSTMAGMKHDLMSVGPGVDLGKLVEPIGVKITPGLGGENKVPASFIKPVIKVWATIMQALKEHIKSNNVRLFVTGHSLGGAFATLFSFIMAEGKISQTIPIMAKIKNLHLITYGAPTTLSDIARNTFNKHLEPTNPGDRFSLMTLDRVVSQLVPARSASGQSLQGAAILLGPNDGVPTVPAGFSHPGFRPLATDLNPESGGRPYTLDKVRQFYGVPSSDRSFRDFWTWPFEEPIDLDSIHKKSDVQAIVRQMTGGLTATDDTMPSTKQLEENASGPDVKEGGGVFTSDAKAIYNKKTNEHIPDFLSIRGSSWASGFSHAEYFGMFFVKALRKPGMKNPASGSNIAYFGLYPSGVRIQWFDQVKKSSVGNYMPSAPTTVSAIAPQVKPGLTEYMKLLGKEKRVGGESRKRSKNSKKANTMKKSRG